MRKHAWRCERGAKVLAQVLRILCVPAAGCCTGAAAKQCGDLTKIVKEYMFRGSKSLKAVSPDSDDPSARVVLLNPELVTDATTLAGMPEPTQALLLALLDAHGGR